MYMRLQSSNQMLDASEPRMSIISMFVRYLQCLSNSSKNEAVLCHIITLPPLTNQNKYPMYYNVNANDFQQRLILLE